MSKKLSELIWDGAKKRPPTAEGWYGKDTEGRLTTCAMMAALDSADLVCESNGCFDFSKLTRSAVGMDRVNGVSRVPPPGVVCYTPPEWFLALTRMRVTPPCGCKVGGSSPDFFAVIPHLHDVHKWSREATAMWVESVENDYEKGRTTLCPGWGGRAPAPAVAPAREVVLM